MTNTIDHRPVLSSYVVQLWNSCYYDDIPVSLYDIMTGVVSIIIQCIRAIGSNHDHPSIIYAIVSGTTAGNKEKRFQPLLHLKNPAAQRGHTAMNMTALRRTHIGKRRN